MGAAAGIIGLGMQAVGTFSSTNTNSLNRSNAYAIKVAEQNATQQEALLKQQAAASDQFAKYQYEQQLTTYQGQRDLARQQMESQYQANLYSNQISTLQSEVQRYGEKISSELSKATYNLEYENTLKANKLSKLENSLSLQAGQLSRNMKRTDAEAAKGLQQISSNIEKSKISLADLSLVNDQANINLQRQGIKQNESDLQLSESQSRRELDTASSQGNIRQMQGEQSAYNQKGDFYRQLLSQFTGNEQDYNKYAAKLNALGMGTGVQGAGLSQDMYNNSDIYNQRQHQRNIFGQSMGNANLENEYTQSQVKAGRSDLINQGISKRNSFGLQEMSLQQGEAGLAAQQSSNNLSRQALAASNAQQDIERQSLLMSLSLEDTYDIFSKQLLPDLQNTVSENNAKQQLGLQTASQGLTDYQNDFNYNLTNSSLGRERQANATNYTSAQDTTNADYNRQTQAAQANYNSTLGTNKSSLAAALAQIASNQYGVLSSLSSRGGSSGMNWNGINGLISQAAQLYGSMQNSTPSYPTYSTMRNPMGTQTNSFNPPKTGTIKGTTGGF